MPLLHLTAQDKDSNINARILRTQSSTACTFHPNKRKQNSAGSAVLLVVFEGRLCHLCVFELVRVQDFSGPRAWVFQALYSANGVLGLGLARCLRFSCTVSSQPPINPKPSSPKPQTCTLALCIKRLGLCISDPLNP